MATVAMTLLAVRVGERSKRAVKLFRSERVIEGTGTQSAKLTSEDKRVRKNLAEAMGFEII